MIILRDTTGITVKRAIQYQNHVRLDVLESCYWIDGVRRNVRKLHKPHGEFTVDELNDMLHDMETIFV